MPTSLLIHSQKLVQIIQSVKSELRSEFSPLKSNYVCNSSKSEYYASVELVDKMVTSLKDGKVPVIDNITSEHIKHSYSIIITLLTKLYNLMIKYDYVPDAFGIGFTVPVPKSANGNCYHRTIIEV